MTNLLLTQFDTITNNTIGDKVVKFFSIFNDPSPRFLRRRSHAKMDAQRSRLRWYVLSAAAVGVALLLNLTAGGCFGLLIIWPFLLAVIVSAGYGGMGPGLTAAGLSLAARTVLSASVDLPFGPLALGLWLATFSGVEVLSAYLIVARRRDEAALHRSKRRFHLLTEVLPQLVWAA